MGFFRRLACSFGLILLGAGGAAQAAEVMHMPFDCRFDGALVHLRPSEERTYAVIGRREHQVFTTCSPADPDRCSSWLVHRFVFDCNGDRVAWIDAAAAATRYADWDAWIEGGSFRMRMGPMWGVARARPLFARRRWMHRHAFGPDPREAFGPDARDVYRARIVTVPPGFAPAVGIPLTFSGGAPDVAEVPDTTPSAVAPSTSAVAAYAAEPTRPSIPELPERAPPREQRLAVASPSALVAPAPKLATKTAANVETQPAPPKVEAASPTTSPSVAANAARTEKPPANATVSKSVTAGAKTQGFTIINAPHADASAPSTSKPQVSSPPAAPIETATVKSAEAESVTSAHSDAQQAEPVANAAPAPSASEPASRPGVALPPLSVKTATAAATTLALAGLAVFGIRRWRRRPFEAPPPNRDIADISLDGGHRALEFERPPAASSTPPADKDTLEIPEVASDLPVPTTYAEALEVLGASQDASTGAIKKIVDGLRKSWHPDHARSETDRRHREARVRQINVAWDLVSQRRSAA